MKLSNIMLSMVACVALYGAVTASSMVVSTRPTSVISVPSEDGSRFTVELPPNLSHRQTEILGMAYNIAKKDGHKYPQLLQGILMQESNAGELSSYKVAGQEFGLKTNERYYGVGQIKLAAAKYVLDKYPDMRDDFEFHTRTDEEVIAKLIENDQFNISVASKYLLVLKSFGYDTMKQLALAYNQGVAGARGKDADTNAYSNGVMKHSKTLYAQK